jgi:chromosome segregation ATPase
MRLNETGDDIDATAVLPQLDIHILSAALERVEHDAVSHDKADIHSNNASPVRHEQAPEWKLTDQLAAFQDQVATLQAALRESENRNTRLASRHETLLRKFEERESALADSQVALRQANNRLIELEQQVQLAAADTTEMRQLVTDSIQQRRLREQFILKQASEIKRLRELLP